MKIHVSKGNVLVDLFTPEELADEVCRLIDRVREAERALAGLVNEIGTGRNLGKSWSEYQIDDAVIAEAKAYVEHLNSIKSVRGLKEKA